MKTEKRAVPIEEMSPLITGLIAEGVDVTITVTGNSMKPLLTTHRDTVVLTKCDPLKLKVGDIPLYKRENGKYILHRIVKVNDTTYDMAGDHQAETEYGVNKSQVLCVVKAFTRNGKLYTVTHPVYRAYSWLWRIMLPMRGFVMRTHGKLHNLFKRKRKQK